MRFIFSSPLTVIFQSVEHIYAIRISSGVKRMKSNRQPDRAMQSYFQVYVKGVIVACIVALLLFAILALLITYTNISESIDPGSG